MGNFPAVAPTWESLQASPVPQPLPVEVRCSWSCVHPLVTSPRPSGAGSDSEALETPVQLSGAQFLCRAAESEPDVGRGNLGTGFLATVHRHPTAQSHTSGRLPPVELGFRSSGGASSVLPAVPKPPGLHLERGWRRVPRQGRGPFLSTVHSVSA